MKKEKTTNNNSNHNNTIIGKWDMYIYSWRRATGNGFLKLSVVVIRWPTKAPEYAVDVAGEGGGGGKRVNKRINK